MRGSWDDALGIAMEAAGLIPGPALDPAKLNGLSNNEQEDTLGTAQCAMRVFLAFERPDRGVLGDRAYYTRLFESTSRATRAAACEIVACACAVIGRLVNSGHAQELGGGLCAGQIVQPVGELAAAGRKLARSGRRY